MVSSLTQADVARLLAEPSAAARAEVAHKLAQEIDGTTLSEAELELANDIVRIMARDVEATVRRALSENLRRARHLPHDVALRLANDVESVALPILSDSPVLTDADLVAIIRQGPSRKQEAVANRDEISEQVSDALVTAGSEAAVATLMANASAQIAEEALGAAINRFADSERVKASMVHRANLPVTIAERLVVMVSDQLQSYLVRHHVLPVSLATDLVLQSRERATLHFSLGSSEQELERLVRQMHRNQRLTPLLVLRALCVGDLPFFEMAMAVMANIPVRNARILIHDAGPNGLASLYEKSGMPRRLLSAVRVAVDVVHGTEFDGGERDRERFRSRVITRILTQFEDLPQEELDYLLEKLSDVLVIAETGPQ
ncbi:MAG TPA: DUF2336 domain-containing protein [Acetobacteraceae bacterium]|jgi:uncharacterized protein (DUF2336 family)|nr:DUF2336 domain-containing protein [Acetobacteraceae bacterium]